MSSTIILFIAFLFTIFAFLYPLVIVPAIQGKDKIIPKLPNTTVVPSSPPSTINTFAQIDPESDIILGLPSEAQMDRLYNLVGSKITAEDLAIDEAYQNCLNNKEAATAYILKNSNDYGITKMIKLDPHIIYDNVNKKCKYQVEYSVMANNPNYNIRDTASPYLIAKPIGKITVNLPSSQSEYF